jgi:hypothetical protein
MAFDANIKKTQCIDSIAKAEFINKHLRIKR